MKCSCGKATVQDCTIRQGRHTNTILRQKQSYFTVWIILANSYDLILLRFAFVAVRVRGWALVLLFSSTIHVRILVRSNNPVNFQRSKFFRSHFTLLYVTIQTIAISFLHLFQVYLSIIALAFYSMYNDDPLRVSGCNEHYKIM